MLLFVTLLYTEIKHMHCFDGSADNQILRNMFVNFKFFIHTCLVDLLICVGITYLNFV